ncbi:MAG: polymer-forming cytoskeletal protein [Nitrospirota bacterium]
MWQRNGDSHDGTSPQAGIVGFLGHQCTMQGTLHFDGTMRIDGRMEGKIITTGSLIVGEGGQVKADIQAGVVVCGGTIDGTVVAKERVQLLAPSVLTGTVRTPLLLIEEGAQFNGTCEMKDRGATVKSLKRAGEAGAATQPDN